MVKKSLTGFRLCKGNLRSLRTGFVSLLFISPLYAQEVIIDDGDTVNVPDDESSPGIWTINLL